MREYTPVSFLKHMRDDWCASAGKMKCCGWMIGDMRMGDKDLRFWRVNIPNYIPAKYHARIQSAWREFLIRIAFEHAGGHIGYAERFRLSQKNK